MGNRSRPAAVITGVEMNVRLPQSIGINECTKRKGYNFTD